MEAQLRPYQKAAINALLANPKGEMKISLRKDHKVGFALPGGFMDVQTRERIYMREWFEEGGAASRGRGQAYMSPEERNLGTLGGIVLIMKRRHPGFGLRLGDDMTSIIGATSTYRRGVTIEIDGADGAIVFAARGWGALGELIALALMHLDDWLWSHRGTPAASSRAPVIAKERISHDALRDWEGVSGSVSVTQWSRTSTARRG